jgi:hypothetical protein
LILASKFLKVSSKVISFSIIFVNISQSFAFFTSLIFHNKFLFVCNKVDLIFIFDCPSQPTQGLNKIAKVSQDFTLSQISTSISFTKASLLGYTEATSLEINSHLKKSLEDILSGKVCSYTFFHFFS